MEDLNTYIGLGIAFAIVGGFIFARKYQQKRFEEYHRRSQQAFREGNLAAAEAALKKCLKLMPIWADGHRAMGEVLARKGEIEKGAERMHFAAQLQPRNPLGHLELAHFLVSYQPDAEAQAREALNQAIALEPTLAEELAVHDRYARLLQKSARD